MRFPKIPRLWQAGSGAKKAGSDTAGNTKNAAKKPGGKGLPGRRILAVEMAGDDIRAAVVRRQGRGFEIIDYATLKRPETGEDLPDVASLRALAERLGVGGGAAVLVSPLARAFELLMDRAKIKGMKPYQLREAVKWEVEPYTGISGVTALIAVERKQEPKVKPGDIVYEDDEQTTVNVAAIERNVYRAVRERFKVAGFRLARIYPPESCFYYVLRMDGRDTPRAVLEVGQDYSNFAVLSGGIPQQINTLSLSQESIAAHVSGEIPSQDLVDTLRFTVRQVPEPEPLVLSGPGATDQAVADFISEFCPHGAVPLDLPRSAGLADAKGDRSHAVYGTVVGAAMRELHGATSRMAGIDDSVPLAVRIRRSAYLVPVAITGLLILTLAGHFVFMKHQERVFKDEIASFEKEIKDRKSRIAQYEDLSKELAKVQAENEQAAKRLDYMLNTADKGVLRLIESLRDLGRVRPDSVSLDSIVLTGSTTLTITGSATQPTAPGDYATAIQALAWCETVVLNGISAGGSAAGKTGAAAPAGNRQPAKSPVPRSGGTAADAAGTFGFALTVTVKGGFH